MEEDKDFLYDMYGPQEEQKEEPKAYQQLAGLKLTGSHEYILDINGKTIRVANSSYVGLLEKQIRELKNEIRNLQTSMNRLARAHNKSVDDMQKINSKITNLPSVFGEG